MRREVSSLVAAAALFAPVGCSEETPPAEKTPPVVVPPSVSRSGMPHGDHSPHHGGLVLMHGDLHFEVVLDPEGRHRIYFTDAIRAELPAAVASDVEVTIVRPGEEPERLELAIDEFGESWVASGRPVEDRETVAFVSFVYQDEPYEIELPFFAKPPDPDAPDPHASPPPA